MFKLYNTLTRRLEPFEPIEPGRVRMYSCGPTVYRYIHIGNLRTFLMADWLRRTLAYRGLEVRHIKNITDVGHMRVEMLDRGEDKLIAQARKEGKTSAQIAEFYTEAFLEDERRLNILPAHVFPRATEHIPEMQAIAAGLLAKGLAYEAGGNVFFDVRRFPEYGKLSGNLLAQMLAGVRDAADPYRRNPEDFPLWKLAEPGREMSWESPWGRGFPGWHIECSAMAIKHLGEQFDIHTGGVDNIFPHHEDEIAQSEGFTGRRFVNYWLHAQHLLADGQKMAKSTGNAYTRADVEARGFDPMALRLLFAMIHYRSRLNFTFSSLRAAEVALRRLRAAALRLAHAAGGHGLPSAQLSPAAEAWRARFVAALEHDLNLPRALAAVWDMLRRDRATPPAERLALLLEFDEVLGLRLAEWLRQATNQRATTKDEEDLAREETTSLVAGRSSQLPEEIAALVQQRAALRAAGRYAEADALRERIAAAGFGLRDTPAGSVALPRLPEDEFGSISRPADAPDHRGAADRYAFSVNLLAQNSRADLQRCVESVARHAGGRLVELVIVDNGSTDDTVAYLQHLARDGVRAADGAAIPLTVLFADHNMGFAAGRNATMRASRGRVLLLIDTSIELRGDIWAPIERALADEQVGLVGPYGLATDDLKEFYESAGPDVDAVEGYLMAFRRALLPEIGPFEEKFRFYRLLDVYESFMVKTAGYRVVALPEVAEQIVKHPHREWYSLSDDERATKSKKNFDIYKRRWHHGQGLTVREYVPADRWFGHDHANHLGTHSHPPEELPPPGVAHTHKHQHWPDHDHEHPHVHG
ncbi:cysteine--tRNA ligase [Kouleothrix sp.]|uniref:cysteine--tRNA ligase n=1 Tax=Kouleothrix sp. TaxID=2779161 RepID=UPI003919BCAB